MEALCNKGENFQRKKYGSCSSPCSATKGVKNKLFISSSSGSCSSDLTEQEKNMKRSSSIRKATVSKCSNSDEKENEPVSHVDDKKITSISSKISSKFLNFFLLCSVYNFSYIALHTQSHL